MAAVVMQEGTVLNHVWLASSPGFSQLFKIARGNIQMYIEWLTQAVNIEKAGRSLGTRLAYMYDRVNMMANDDVSHSFL